MDPDFVWGTVVPSYLGAFGSIAASGIAAAALIRDVRTRKGLREVAQASSEAVHPNPAVAYPARAPVGESKLELTQRGNRTVIRNLTPLPIVVTALEVPSGGKDITLHEGLPATVQPGEGFGFIVHQLLSGPAIAALDVQWVDGQGTPQRSRFFI